MLALSPCLVLSDVMSQPASTATRLGSWGAIYVSTDCVCVQGKQWATLPPQQVLTMLKESRAMHLLTTSPESRPLLPCEESKQNSQGIRYSQVLHPRIIRVCMCHTAMLLMQSVRQVCLNESFKCLRTTCMEACICNSPCICLHVCPDLWTTKLCSTVNNTKPTRAGMLCVQL